MSTNPHTDDERLKQITVGERREHNSTIHLASYDPNWPHRYQEIKRLIVAALGDRALMVEHVGSTSVPGLAAKPIIDVVLEVADSDVERDYVSPLEESGFCLRIREKDWYKHRLLKLEDVNLHVFSAECIETTRMLRFRNWLRSHPEDRDVYERKKKELAARVWKHVQNYADAKSEVVQSILAKADLDQADA